MNEFIDVGSQIARPRRSQQDIFIQRLRKRVEPIFYNYKKQAKSAIHHVSLDPFKKNRTSRIKTCHLEEQNQFHSYSELNDSTSSAPNRSKKATFFESCQPLQEEKTNSILLKPRKVLLPKLRLKRVDLVSLSGEDKYDEVRNSKLATLPENVQLVTFYPFKRKKE